MGQQSARNDSFEGNSECITSNSERTVVVRHNGFGSCTKPITMSNYDNLHRQCRTLENQFDVKLASYSQLVSSISRSKPDLEASGSLERWKDLETELEELLAKVRI